MTIMLMNVEHLNLYPLSIFVLLRYSNRTTVVRYWLQLLKLNDGSVFNSDFHHIFPGDGFFFTIFSDEDVH